MPKCCAIPGCESQFGRTTMFSVTSTPTLAQWWKATPWSTKRDNGSSPQGTQICLAHFSEDQLDKSHRVPRLIANIVPSLNLPDVRKTTSTLAIQHVASVTKQEHYSGDPLAENNNPLLLYCRFCGKKQKNPIQNHLEDLVKSEELLQLCLGRGRFLEGFPNGVCDPCLKMIKVTTNFIGDCEKAQGKLQKMFFGTTQQMADSFEEEEEQEREIEHSFAIPETIMSLDETDDVQMTHEYIIKDEDPIGEDDEEDDDEEDEDEIEDNRNTQYVGHLMTELPRTQRSKHSETNADGSDIRCVVCDRTFNRKRALKAHMESIHEKRTFACKVCGKTMGWRKTLQRHMKSHEENYYKHKCDLCDKSFSRPSHLRLHMIKHTGQKLRCPLCNGGYRCNYKLGEHIIKAHQMDPEVAKIWVQQAGKV